jgi:hypothetical protein
MRHKNRTKLGTSLVVSGLLLTVLVGCGKSHPSCIQVSGRVTYRGKPVTSGYVSFVRIGQNSAEGLTRPATGELDEGGSYAMKTFQKDDGVLPGEYGVSIVSVEYGHKREPTGALPSLIPRKYASIDTSGLKATVPADASGRLTLDFDLAN